MSYTNRKENLKNPVQMFIEWNNKGYFSYYNKETKQEVSLSKMRFVVLDQLNTIKGFHKATQTGIFANEVHNLSKEDFKVQTYKKLLVAGGKYNDIKDTIKAVGGKFCKAVYVLLFNEEGTDFNFVSLQLTGASLNVWFDTLDNLTNLYETGFIWDGSFSNETNGGISYTKPIFKTFKEIPESIDAEAQEKDTLLQNYFKQYKDVKEEPPKQNFDDIDDIPDINEVPGMDADYYEEQFNKGFDE